MALIHDAELQPSKIEVLRGWCAAQSWFTGNAAALHSLGAYRFDDPGGEVGIETHLLRAGSGPVFQVPTTYHGAPLSGGGEQLLATMDHSVLGPRWMYDATVDPAFIETLAATIWTGDTEAELEYVTAGGRDVRRSGVRVRGSGGPEDDIPALYEPARELRGSTTVITTEGLRLVVRHVLSGPPPPGEETLSGTWPGQDEPVVLATATATG